MVRRAVSECLQQNRSSGQDFTLAEPHENLAADTISVASVSEIDKEAITGVAVCQSQIGIYRFISGILIETMVAGNSFQVGQCGFVF